MSRLLEIHRSVAAALLVLLPGLAVVENVHAHKVSSVSAIVDIDTKNRTYELNAAMDVERSEDEALNDEISPEDAARTFAEEFLVIQFDKVDQSPELNIETVTSSDENTPEELQRQQVVATLTGPIPEGAKEFLMYLDPSCPMAVVMVVVKDKKPARRMQVVLAGEFSRPVNVEPTVAGDPFTEAPAEPGSGSEEAGTTEVVPVHDEKTMGAFRAGWSTYFKKPLLHIGILIAILVTTLSLKPVTYRLGALLIGQSLGTSLAAFQLIPVPSLLFPAIGCGLMILSIGALISRNLHAVRIGAILVLGGLQGIFFTQMLPFRRLFSEGGIHDVSRLIGFHVGVEVAQLVSAVLAAAVLLVLSRYHGYRRIIVSAIVALLAGYGLFVAGSVIL